jgi:hypothetical protein
VAKLSRDEKLLESETPFDQVARMGNTWKSEEQYLKQLELPVHLVTDTPVPIERDGAQVVGYRTACGLAIGGEGSTRDGKNRGEGTLRSTDDPDDVTCQACRE